VWGKKKRRTSTGVLLLRANGYITCVVAGWDSASDADTSEAGEMLTEAADSTTSGACFVRRTSLRYCTHHQLQTLE